MKKILIGALAILAIAAPLAASAAPKAPKQHAASTTKAKIHTTSGVVSAWAPGTRMLTLKDGAAFKLDDKVTAINYAAGQNVTVSWESKDGAKLAEGVTIK